MIVMFVGTVERITGRNVIVNIHSQNHWGFVGPTSWHILYCVATTSQNDSWDSKSEHIVDALCMTFHWQVEMAQSIFRQGISSTLDDHSIRSVETHARIHNFFEELKVGPIINPFLQRHVNSIISPNSFPNWVQSSSSREEIFIELMETDSHDSIGMIKCFLNSITMMNINIKVQYSWMHFEHLENADDYVVDVTKSWGLRFFGMMVASSPIHSNVRYTSENDISSINAASSSQLTKMIEPLEARTIKRLIDLKQGPQLRIIPDLPLLIILISANNLILLASDPILQIINISRMMKQIKLIFRCFLRLKHGEIVTKFIILDERMSHFYPLCFHWMFLTEMIVCYWIIVDIAYFTHSGILICLKIMRLIDLDFL